MMLGLGEQRRSLTYVPAPERFSLLGGQRGHMALIQSVLREEHHEGAQQGVIRKFLGLNEQGRGDSYRPKAWCRQKHENSLTVSK